MFNSTKIKSSDDHCITFGLSNPGMKRINNEDAFWINHSNNIFIVVDGMGGHNAGEIASNMAIEILKDELNEKSLIGSNSLPEKIENLFYIALSNASTKIIKAGKDEPLYSGMGCTVVIAWLNNNILYTSHVGDSRIYVCNNENIIQLGLDHTHVAEIVKAGQMTKEEARHSPLKNQITQALGMPVPIEPEHIKFEIKTGDRILLCSDGLWDMLSDSDIHQIMMSMKDAKSISEKLVEMANEAGGKDNITVIVSICP
jgi:PPM family protein phosphatase